MKEENGMAPQLILKVGGDGKAMPHCHLYSLTCGGCDGNAALRSIQKSMVAGIPCVLLGFQCDKCKLKWHLSMYETKKNIRNQKPSTTPVLKWGASAPKSL